jgi:hypothetical protein
MLPRPHIVKWFRCDVCCYGRHCGRRVALLYSCGGLFACRHCHDLDYESQHEPVRYRGIARARKIRMRLGGGPNITAPFPDRPKGMHWQRYDRLRRPRSSLCAVARGTGEIHGTAEILDEGRTWRRHSTVIAAPTSRGGSERSSMISRCSPQPGADTGSLGPPQSCGQRRRQRRRRRAAR